MVSKKLLLAGAMCATLAVPQFVLADTNDDAVLRVSGSASISVKPNIAYISLGVKVQEQSAEVARKKVEEAINNFKSNLAKEITSEGAYELTAQDISLYPNYEYDKVKKRSVQVGYNASRDVRVQVKDFTLLSQIIGIGLKSGLNQVSNVSYSLDNFKVVRSEVRELAAKDAQSKAQSLAQNFGVTIKGIKEINYNTINYDENQVAKTYARSAMANGIAADNANVEGVYEPKNINLNDNIDVVYIIKNK